MGKFMELINNLHSKSFPKSSQLNDPKTQIPDADNLINEKLLLSKAIYTDKTRSNCTSDSNASLLGEFLKQDCWGCRITGSLTFCVIGVSTCCLLAKKAKGKTNLQKSLLIINGALLATVFSTLATLRLLNIRIFSSKKCKEYIQSQN